MKRFLASTAALFFFTLPCQLNLLAQSSALPQSASEIPFEFVHGAILVRVTLNSQGPFWMMLDTGADPSIVDLQTAKSLGLKIAASGEQGSGGGTNPNPAYATSFPQLQLGGLTATNVDALAMDLSKISAGVGRSVAGVLGQSFLNARVVQIDYPNLRVRFLANSPPCDEAAPQKTTTCTVLPFRYQDDILATGVTVSGKAVITNVDTGSNSTFQLTPAAVDKLGLRDEVARSHASTSVGFNGELKNHEGTLRHVKVGTIPVEDSPVIFFGQGMGMDEEPWDLRIGNAFLKGYVLTLDYPHGKITIATP